MPRGARGGLLRGARVFLHAVVAGEAEYETEATKYRSR